MALIQCRGQSYVQYAAWSYMKVGRNGELAVYSAGGGGFSNLWALGVT